MAARIGSPWFSGLVGDAIRRRGFERGPGHLEDLAVGHRRGSLLGDTTLVLARVAKHTPILLDQLARGVLLERQLIEDDAALAQPLAEEQSVGVGTQHGQGSRELVEQNVPHGLVAVPQGAVDRHDERLAGRSEIAVGRLHQREVLECEVHRHAIADSRRERDRLLEVPVGTSGVRRAHDARQQQQTEREP